MKKTKRSLLAFLAIAIVAVLALCCVLGFAACGSKECAHENVTWDETKTVEATCVDDGSKTGVCDDCGETVTETIPATGEHTWDDGVVTKNASTDGGDGEITYTCTICKTTTDTKSFTGEYLAKFVTGAYDSTNTSISEQAYSYTNPDAGDDSTATFTGSIVTSVEFDGAQYIVNGIADPMSDAQLKAFWGQNNYSEHAGAEYIAILITADKSDSYTIVSSKSPDGIQMGGADAEENADYNEGYSLFFDVTNAEAGAWLFTIVDSYETEYDVVLGDVTLVTDYTSNFVTGAYDSGNTSIPEEAYKYTNPDDSTLTATFTGSSISVERVGTTYIVSGTSAVMSDDDQNNKQLTAFWGNGASDHTGDEYIAILITAGDTDSYTIISSKSPEGIAMGGAGVEGNADYNEGYSLFFDVTDASEGAWLFTIVDSNGVEYDVVLGSITSSTTEDGE